MKKIREFINKHETIISWLSVVLMTFSVIILICICVGCTEYVNGAGETVTRLSNDTAGVLDTGSEMAPVVQSGLAAATIAFPALAGLFGAVAGGIGIFFQTYKKYRPQLTEAQSKVDASENMTRALVEAIEEYKGENEEDWEGLKGYLKNKLLNVVGPEALAVIETLIEEYNSKV